MAKAKKSKSNNTKAKSTGSDVPKKDAAKKEDAPPIVKRVETAFDVGNYAAVRALGNAAVGEHLEGKALARVDEALEKTKTEPLVWAIGIAALVLALIVALATLGG